MEITWPELHLPPINQYCLSCALWFYYPEEYKKILEEINSRSNKLETGNES